MKYQIPKGREVPQRKHLRDSKEEGALFLISQGGDSASPRTLAVIRRSPWSLIGIGTLQLFADSYPDGGEAFGFSVAVSVVGGRVAAVMKYPFFVLFVSSERSNARQRL